MSPKCPASPVLVPSLNAPYETFVDLNLTTQSAGGASGVEGMPSTCDPPRPPSDTDLGGCLWGPRQNESDGGSGGASQSGGIAATRETGPPGRQGSLRSLSGSNIPRSVTFAYVAQPGGRLWRVGLLDGEVESTFRPPVLARASGVGGSSGAGTGSCSEIGRMQTVHADGSQVIVVYDTSASCGFSSRLPPFRPPSLPSAAYFMNVRAFI